MDNTVKENIFIPSMVVSDLIHNWSQQLFRSLITISVISVSMVTNHKENTNINGMMDLSNCKIVVTDNINSRVK